ncbi:hypothetical protein Tco_0400999 [Tanacetum coccineum]
MFARRIRTMEELLRAPTEGYGEAIVLPEINADHFEIKTNLLQLVQANPVIVETTREALNIIENKSKVRYSRNKTNASRVNSKENVSKTDERIDKLADQLSTLVEIVSKKVVVPPAPVKAVEENCVYLCVASCMKSNDQTIRNLQYQITSMKGELKNEIQNTIKNQQTALKSQNNAFQTNLQNNLQNMLSSFFQAQASPSGTLSSNTIPNPKGEMKAITTRSGVAYEGPSNPTKPSLKKVVERETEEITDEEQNDFQGSTAQIPPPVIPKPISEPEIPKTLPKSTPIPEPEIPKTVPKANIPYPSRRDNQKNREKASLTPLL